MTTAAAIAMRIGHDDTSDNADNIEAFVPANAPLNIPPAIRVHSGSETLGQMTRRDSMSPPSTSQ